MINFKSPYKQAGFSSASEALGRTTKRKIYYEISGVYNGLRAKRLAKQKKGDKK
jgi:hypothetical protein